MATLLSVYLYFFITGSDACSINVAFRNVALSFIVNNQGPLNMIMIKSVISS